ncbi:MAG: hypothetical protein ABH950_05995 [Candidatus Altiarchaeota archaeon]
MNRLTMEYLRLKSFGFLIIIMAGDENADAASPMRGGDNPYGYVMGKIAEAFGSENRKKLLREASELMSSRVENQGPTIHFFHLIQEIRLFMEALMDNPKVPKDPHGWIPFTVVEGAINRLNQRDYTIDGKAGRIITLALREMLPRKKSRRRSSSARAMDEIRRTMGFKVSKEAPTLRASDTRSIETTWPYIVDEESGLSVIAHRAKNRVVTHRLFHGGQQLLEVTCQFTGRGLGGTPSIVIRDNSGVMRYNQTPTRKTKGDLRVDEEDPIVIRMRKGTPEVALNVIKDGRTIPVSTLNLTPYLSRPLKRLKPDLPPGPDLPTQTTSPPTTNPKTTNPPTTNPQTKKRNPNG